MFILKFFLAGMIHIYEAQEKEMFAVCISFLAINIVRFLIITGNHFVVKGMEDLGRPLRYPVEYKRVVVRFRKPLWVAEGE